MVKDDLIKFSLHYFLDDNSHSMDARVRNQCEAHFLTLAYEAIEILGFDLQIEAEASSEGGVKDWWKVFGDNSAQIAIVISTLALIYSVVPKEDKELVELQKQDLMLSIQQRKLALAAIKKDAANKVITQTSIESAVLLINQSNKALVAKSNFFKKLVGYNKVTQLGVAAANDKGEIVLPEKVITKDSFPKYVLKTQKLKPVIDDEAVITVAAPGILEGYQSWKGTYKDQSFTFKMNDVDFQDDVIAKKYRFASGDAICCEFYTHKKLDQAGEIVTTGHSVEVVLDYLEGDVVTQTHQGRAYRLTKKQRDNQHELFSEVDL
ncbi:MAG: hypothetical protein RPR91_07315 [Colwellia sp.]